MVDKKLESINYQAFKEARKNQDECILAFSDTPKRPCDLKIKNYFEQLKTDKHQKHTKYMSLALDAFLSSVKMIVFQNLHSVQEIVDYEIKQMNKNVDQTNHGAAREKNMKGKNIKSQFLEKSKNILRAMETIYINDKLMKINIANPQIMNDLQKNPYISDEKSCITGLNGISAIMNKNALNTSQDTDAFNYSHIDNMTEFKF